MTIKIVRRVLLARFVVASLTAFLWISATGCGPDLSHLPKTVRAEGVVTLDGTPVESATVTFIGKKSNYNASAVTDSSGRFSLNSFTEKPGAVPGDYAVEINKTLAEAGGGTETGLVSVKYGLPKKYASMGTSGLSQTIPDKDTTDMKFELSSKK